jgi:hypothetical protein
MQTHDAIHDTFVTIVKDFNFHMGWKQLHMLSLIILNSSLFNNGENLDVYTNMPICSYTNVPMLFGA